MQDLIKFVAEGSKLLGEILRILSMVLGIGGNNLIVGKDWKFQTYMQVEVLLCLLLGPPCFLGSLASGTSVTMVGAES